MRGIPKVTVLMSVLNGGAYFPAAVESVLSQSFGDFEFLIIDDGSSEPLMDVVSRFKDRRIVVHRQENMGLTRSLNKGLRMARGRYVARMDADDMSLPGRLEAQVGKMDGNDLLDMVGTFFDVVDGEGKLIERKELIVDPIYRLWRLQFHNNYGHGSMMLRRASILDAGGYDESLRYAQDYELWSRVSRKDNTSIIPTVYYQYRLIEQSAQSSVKNYDTQLENAIRISNGSLKKCRPSFTDTDCEEVRALYWKFQRDCPSRKGLMAVPETLDGFCRRYGIEAEERAGLVQRVAADTLEEAAKFEILVEEDRKRLAEEFLRTTNGPAPSNE